MVQCYDALLIDIVTFMKKQLGKRIKWLFLKFDEGKYFWLFLLLFAFGFIVLLYCREHTVLLAQAYQLIGAISVLTIFRRKMLIFRSVKIRTLVVRYFKSLFTKPEYKYKLRWSDKVYVKEEIDTEFKRDLPQPSVEEVIQYFNEKIENLRNERILIEKDLRFEIGILKQDSEEEISKLRTGYHEIENKVENWAVKDYWLELFGIAMILYGTFLMIAKDVIHVILDLI